jgi:L-methionine (R)-S-oxide reductase
MRGLPPADRVVTILESCSVLVYQSSIADLTHWSNMNKQEIYDEVLLRIGGILDGENDRISAMAQIACELYHAFEQFHWVGFYRRVGDELLKIGPYQGGHGCSTIDFSRGVCGKCATEKQTQIIDDVTKIPFHIACSSTTRSEIVVPVLDSTGDLIAVLDIDSDDPAAFDDLDAQMLGMVCAHFRGMA